MILTPISGDNTEYINAALAANRTVYLDGEFEVSGTLTLKASGNSLLASFGRYAAIHANRAAGDCFSMIVNASGGTGSYILDGFSIYANGQLLTTLNEDIANKRAHGIYIAIAHQTIIRNIKVFDTGLRAIGISSSSRVVIDSCTVENVGYIPYVNQTDLRWDVKADGNGISLNNCRDSIITNSTAKNCRDLGITLWQCRGSSIQNCHAETNMTAVATTNTRGGFSIEDVAIATYGDNEIINCTSLSNSGVIIQVSTPHSLVKNISITDNVGRDGSTANDVHNSHFENIISSASVDPHAGFLLGQATDTANNVNVTFKDCNLGTIVGSGLTGITANKITSGWIKNTTIRRANTGMSGIVLTNCGVGFTESENTVI